MKTVVCRFTGIEVPESEAIRVGSTVPGVHADYWMANTPEALSAKKQWGILFHQNEANCNTCRHLERVKHTKDPAGFLKGKCLRSLNSISFHPDDPMFNSCYESRWA